MLFAMFYSRNVPVCMLFAQPSILLAGCNIWELEPWILHAICTLLLVVVCYLWVLVCFVILVAVVVVAVAVVFVSVVTVVVVLL